MTHPTQAPNPSQVSIPAGWRVQRLGDVCEINPLKSQVSMQNRDMLVSFVPMEYINSNKKLFVSPIGKTIGEVYSGYTYFADNDVLLAKVTPCFENGKSGIANNLLNGLGFGSSELFVLRANKNIMSEILYFTINSYKFIENGKNNFSGTSGLQRISREFIKNFPILLPPLPEQKAIAEVLGTWDEAIEILEKLIKAKKSHKKSLMQKLLTGKVRLKGFSDPWKEVKLGEICDFISGFAFSSNSFKEKGIPLVRISNIDNNIVNIATDVAYIEESFLSKYSQFQIIYNDLLIAMSGATTGKMGINKSNEPMLLNQRVGIIRAFSANQDFINQYLLTFQDEVLKMSYGGAQPNISGNDMKKINIFIPSSLFEQKAIAEIFSMCDTEIGLLCRKLDALKSQKKGLMQKLLTGQWRLKTEGASR